MNDDFSAEVFDTYFDNLDPFKRFFIQEDIKEFSLHKSKLDDYFFDEDLSFYKTTVERLFSRIEQAEKIVEELLDKPLSLSTSDTLVLDLEQASFAKGSIELKNTWKKYLQYQLIQELYTLENSEENKDKSQAELKKMALKEVKENNKDYFRRLNKREKKDFFSSYINAYTHQYDPHTEYFSPKEKEDFDLSVSGKLEGIGAVLRDEKGQVTIVELVIGGPAWKTGELEPEDKIIKVAQGKKEAVNVVGMLLDDAVRLIRGKKGSVVVLTVKKKDGTIKNISIKRDVVEYDEAFAKGTVVDYKGDKFGILNLPSFYIDFNDKNGPDASDDVLEILEDFNKEGVKGILFDVRKNGGGSLREVVEIVGHFIDKGPVVQVQTSDGSKKILEDSKSGIPFDLPVVLMVDEFSASASEILAAAFQDYKRAVIVGGSKTYGKGSVQTVIPVSLSNFSDKGLGNLKITTQKYYRINGGSTQLKGVTPDIQFPSEFSALDISESKKDNALSWDQIEKTDYKHYQRKLSIDRLKKKLQKRLAESDHSKGVEQKAKWLKSAQDKKSVSLNYEDYKKSLEEVETKGKYFDSILKYDSQIKFLNKPETVGAKKTLQDSIHNERIKRWQEQIDKDFVAEQSLDILHDLLSQ